MLLLVALATAVVVRRAEVENGGAVIADDREHPTRGDPHLHNDGHWLMGKYQPVPEQAAAQCYDLGPGKTPPDAGCDKIDHPTAPVCKEIGCGFAPAIEIRHDAQSPKLVPNCYCNTGCGQTKYNGHDITKMYERTDYHDKFLGPAHSPHWVTCDTFEGRSPNSTCHHTLCGDCHASKTPCQNGLYTQMDKKIDNTWPFEDEYLCCRPRTCAVEYEITEHWDAQDEAGDLTGEKDSRVIHGIAYSTAGEHPAPHRTPNSDCKSKKEWTDRGFNTKHKPRSESHDDCFSYGIFSVLYGECGIWR